MTKASRGVLVVAAFAVAAAGVGAWLLLRGEETPERVDRGPVVVEGLLAGEPPFRFEMQYGKCGLVSIVAPSGTTYPENGVFCVIQLNILNDSDQAKTLDPACQVMFDREGTRYEQRVDVLHIDPGSRRAFLRPIAPGAVAEAAALYFDVPEGTKVSTVELHSTCGSRGLLMDVIPPPKEE